MSEPVPTEPPAHAPPVTQPDAPVVSEGATATPVKPAPLLTSGRRRFLVGAGLTLGAAGVGRAVYDWNEGFQLASVAIVKAEDYAADLSKLIADGLNELGFGKERVRGKSVLLKPNLVEPTRVAPHINTHPAVVRAAIETFRRWDAKEVFVGEGQGHIRDSYYVLEQSGLGAALDEADAEFVDLNHDEIFETPNRGSASKLGRLHLPASLRRADIIVSMPKMKTHHWAGVTLSMKNLFGVMPGLRYGWPKNVLHHAGIPNSIVDITATVRPHLAIIDGIVAMEGDGPIMGDAKPMGVLVMGANLPAVDATATRLMMLDPYRIPYLRMAAGWLGPLAEHHIEQRGEPIANLAKPFALLDHPMLDGFRGGRPHQTG